MNNNQKIAVITGSYKGLGLAIARKLAELVQIKVIITFRKETDSQATKQKLVSEGIEVDINQT